MSIFNKVQRLKIGFVNMCKDLLMCTVPKFDFSSFSIFSSQKCVSKYVVDIYNIGKIVSSRIKQTKQKLPNVLKEFYLLNYYIYF